MLELIRVRGNGYVYAHSVECMGEANESRCHFRKEDVHVGSFEASSAVHGHKALVHVEGNTLASKADQRLGHGT